jgi:6-phospho-beta-glucosidase
MSVIQSDAKSDVIGGGWEMKLTVLGGGGVRIPLLIKGLIAQEEACPFEEVVLFDVHEQHLAVMGQLAQYQLACAQSAMQLEFTTNAEEALSNADFIFSAFRVGQNESRIVDERVALRHGVVGQETTGPGGFAMALRTIPEALRYAQIIRDVAPRAWLLNFTNPAGIITQALIDVGKVRTIGICDSPEGIRRRIAHFLGAQADAVEIGYVGLNHLGWVTDVYVDGVSKLSFLLDHYAELRRSDAEFAAFDEELVRHLGMLPNEYLYYFYYGADAVSHLQSVPDTRGEQIHKLTQALLERLEIPLGHGDLAGAWDVYRESMETRSQTYMQREMHGTKDKRADRDATAEDSVGYAGVAMRAAQALTGQFRGPLIVNTPNRAAISQLRDDDVVEVPTSISVSGLRPLACGALPSTIEGLVLSVKQYERLTVQAACTGDRRLAVDALASHPLVPSYTVANHLVDDYLRELAPWLPQFA